VQVESSPEIFFFFFFEADLEKSKKERRAKDVVIRVMEILLDVVMEKNSLEEKTSLSTQVGAPGPAAWASPPPTGVAPAADQLLAWTARSPRSPTR
jgi:hypothetical protein